MLVPPRGASELPVISLALDYPPLARVLGWGGERGATPGSGAPERTLVRLGRTRGHQGRRGGGGGGTCASAGRVWLSRVHSVAPSLQLA